MFSPNDFHQSEAHQKNYISKMKHDHLGGRVLRITAFHCEVPWFESRNSQEFCNTP